MIKLKNFTKKNGKIFDTRENCSACLFMKNNQKVKDLVNFNYKDKSIELNNSVEHINFP